MEQFIPFSMAMLNNQRVYKIRYNISGWFLYVSIFFMGRCEKNRSSHGDILGIGGSNCSMAQLQNGSLKSIPPEEELDESRLCMVMPFPAKLYPIQFPVYSIPPYIFHPRKFGTITIKHSYI